MQIILSSNCHYLAGGLGARYGYAVQKRKSGYYGVRYSRGTVPPDGHWRFIVACAELAKMKLHISDIEIHWMELSDALYEAGKFTANRQVRANGVEGIKLTYNAEDIINLKITFGL